MVGDEGYFPGGDDAARLRRWYTFLSQFNLAIKHIPGVKNEFSDWLSRAEFQNVIGENLNEIGSRDPELRGMEVYHRPSDLAPGLYRALTETPEPTANAKTHTGDCFGLEYAFKFLGNTEMNFVLIVPSRTTAVPYLKFDVARKFIDGERKN